MRSTFVLLVWLGIAAAFAAKAGAWLVVGCAVFVAVCEVVYRLLNRRATL